MKILVTGDRYWSDVETIFNELSSYQPGTIIVHGACVGADLIAQAVAEQLGYQTRQYPANWNIGPAAGPIRNQEMLDKEHVENEPIDLCIAFHDNIKKSKGTKDMIKRALKSDINCKLVRLPVKK